MSFQASQSCYLWEGRVERAHEVQLLIKTTAPGLNALLGVIEALLSYNTPEIFTGRLSHRTPMALGPRRRSIQMLSDQIRQGNL